MSDSSVVDLTKPFASVFEALDVKQQRKALKGAMRKAANMVMKEAEMNVRNSGIGQGTLTPITKSLYTRVYPDQYGAGFMVSVMPKARKGFHVNRQMQEKPVLMWAEEGTRPRHTGEVTSRHKGVSKLTGKKTRYSTRGGAYRGSMKAYHFMRNTENQGTDGIENFLFEQFSKNLDKTAKKLGLL